MLNNYYKKSEENKCQNWRLFAGCTARVLNLLLIFYFFLQFMPQVIQTFKRRTFKLSIL